MPDPTSDAYKRGLQGQPLRKRATQNEYEDHAAGQRANIERQNQTYNQFGNSGGSAYSGGDPLTGLLWLVFVLPFKLIWWTLNGTILRWVFGTWLGRIIFLVITVPLALAIWNTTSWTREYRSLHEDYQAWQPDMAASNATLRVTDLNADRDFECRITVAPRRDGYLTHAGEGCTDQAHPFASEAGNLAVIYPNRRHQGSINRASDEFRWDRFEDVETQDISYSNDGRNSLTRTLEATATGFSADISYWNGDAWQEARLTVELDSQSESASD